MRPESVAWGSPDAAEVGGDPIRANGSCTAGVRHDLSPYAEAGDGACTARSAPVAMVAACPFPCRRGTPIRVERLAEALVAAGREVHVVAYHYGDHATREDAGAGGGTGYHLHRTPWMPGRWNTAPGPGLGKVLLLDPLLVAQTLAVVRRHRVHLLHAHHYEGLLVALAVRALSPVAVVYDAHTLLGEELSYYGPRVLRRPLEALGGFLDRTLPRLADHVIPVTEEIHDFLATEGHAEGRMTVVGNGIEAEVERLIVEMRRHEPSPTPERVVFAGNLATYQGVGVLIEAFAQVAARRPRAELVFVSPGPHDALMAQAVALGLRGRVRAVESAGADLWRELLAGQVLVNPRVRCPGYPLKLLNYMASGRGIVSFASSAKHLQHGVDAWIAADGDVSALAEGIETLLARPELAERLGETAQRTVFDSYSWPKIAARVSEAYDRALEARGLAPVQGATG